MVYTECMPRQRSWTDNQLKEAVVMAKSYRSVIVKLGLIPAGGNYTQVQSRIKDLKLDVAHFTGMTWNKGTTYHSKSRLPIEELLIFGSKIQSFKLKNRLYESGLKLPKCELCGWARVSKDGRIPLELDHINGIHDDNRIDNLRILCPNCHSLQPTHRGKNKKIALARML
ncbi:MAG: hypothetical protein PWQ10_443 [Patescibacteria group bacterium]|nr:hypothetical protein [Patescibacteria group bacterium]